MNIIWKSGERPEKEGDYVVVTAWGSVSTWHFTPEYGWNTFSCSTEHAINDNNVVAWTENFSQRVIDIYGQDDVYKGGKENEDQSHRD